MCTTYDHIKNSRKWNWDGDIIIHNPIIPKTRKVIGTNKHYDVDIREFLTSRDNAVVKRTIGIIGKKLSQKNRDTFFSNKPGSFDFKVRVLTEYIAHEIDYMKGNRNFDAWMFPDETITLKSGDCEDRALLLASLILASGVSNFNLRIAFGKIQNLSNGKNYDHVWIMYKNEGGIWQLIEPFDYCNKKMETTNNEEKVLEKEPETHFNYIPYYLSNDEHLWAIYHPENKEAFKDYITSRSFWKGYNPAYGYGVHRSLINYSIDAQNFFDKLTDFMKDELFFFRKWRNLTPADYLDSFATKVANVDITLNYNPFIHYDNAFIEESFNLMNQNLGNKTLDGLAKALHAVADLYSHSSYPEFAKQNSPNHIELLVTPNPSDANYAAQFVGNLKPFYGSGSSYDLNKKGFSVNSNLYNQPNKTGAIAYWKDKIISGRYGQPNDSHSFLEHTQYWPSNLIPNEMQGALPHHNEIGVDDSNKNSNHVLYSDTDYKNKFDIRKDAASRHIALLFSRW